MAFASSDEDRALLEALNGTDTSSAPCFADPNDPTSIDAACGFIEQSLSISGFAAQPFKLRSTDNKDVAALCNALQALLQSHQKAGAFKGGVDGQLQKMRNDLRQSEGAVSRLMATLEERGREVAAAQGRERQAVSQLRIEALRAQSERDEARRECQALQYRHTRFQHEIRRREGEYERLQDRLRSLLAERRDERQQVEVRVAGLKDTAPPRAASGPAPQSRVQREQQEDLYRMIVSAYDDKIRDLLLENKDLKAALDSLQQDHRRAANQAAAQLAAAQAALAAATSTARAAPAQTPGPGPAPSASHGAPPQVLDPTPFALGRAGSTPFVRTQGLRKEAAVTAATPPTARTLVLGGSGGAANLDASMLEEEQENVQPS